MYETGKREPDFESLELLADYFNVDIDFLIGKSDKPTIVNAYPSHKYAYYQNSCAAGNPTPVNAITTFPLIEVPDVILGKHAGNNSVFFIHANGDSMNKVFPDGAVLAVKPTELIDLKNGEIVIFEDEAHNMSVKRYYRQGSTIIFKPDSTNSSFYDLVYNAEVNQIRIIGKVVTYVVTL